MVVLVDNRYGKSRVRLLHVNRHPEQHDLREWTLDILLEGDFESCFVDGDNSKILPTDTMKNTVYSLARTSSAVCMEDFGQELLAYFFERNPQVTRARAGISEKAWQHLLMGGKPHATTFVQSSGELQTTMVGRNRGGEVSVIAGFDNLVILKTAGSEFVGFLKDSLTTLPEATDRLLGTSLSARWTYAASAHSFQSSRSRIREILVGVFANHSSKSVQHTLYAMGEAALEQVPEIEDIQLSMPNKHCLLVDLSRFGQDNPNEIFQPIDEPHGSIEARLRRRS
jgi:urate oxidase